MISTILICIAISLGTIAVTIIFSPLQLRLSANFKELKPSGTAHFSFLHPWIILIKIQFVPVEVTVRILGFEVFKKIKNNTLSERPMNPPPPAELKPEEIRKNENNESTRYREEPIPVTSTISTTSPSSPATEQATNISSGHSSVRKGKESKPSNKKSPDGIKKNMPVSANNNPAPKETMASKEKKTDNLFEKLKRNRYLFFIRNRGWRKKILKIVGRFFHSLLSLVHFDYLSVSIKAGIKNPMITGSISGWLNAVTSTLSKSTKYSFRFEPVFMINHFESSISFKAGTSIFMLLFPIIMILVTFPYLHTLFILLRYRRLQQKYLHPAAP